MPSEALLIIGMWFQTAFVLFSVYSAKIGTVVFHFAGMGGRKPCPD
ncbi:hypothetical protein NEILACOT_04756 [Neisseria lactamica ATCC 23970]|uniref:Uncharacterized protein n=1 Tax=Neisseria lactamica ATCC 23970 TaxID=546265 RepID=D0WB32_NEILA|nr:hypothetical protein [Neisseria lactamica]EEZ75199.1 hypothetical protein NEILACOT_04756 [Neisseria lactamica ATCC 23970]